MTGPSNQVHLVQIIRADPDCQKPLHKIFHRFGIVVYPFKEYGLIAQGDTCIGKTCAGQGRGPGYLPRMIEVGIDINRVELFQQSAERRGDPFRQGNRYAGAYTDYLDVGYATQPGKRLLQNVIFEEQRIAPREDDVTDGVVGGNIVQRILRVNVRTVVLNSRPSPCACRTGS